MTHPDNQLPSKPTIQLPDAWQTSSQGLENRRKAQNNISLKHGMFAGVPIICRGTKCPFYETCWIPDADLQVGERCPIEIAAIIERFDTYCKALAIDWSNPEDVVDAGIVKEIVDIEIMLLRADNLLAINGTFIEDVIAGISPKGQEYRRPEIHKAAEFKEGLRKEKTRLYNQLNATRKDKKEDLINGNDPSSVAARIIQKVKNFQDEGIIIDAEYEEEDDRELVYVEADNKSEPLTGGEINEES